MERNSPENNANNQHTSNGGSSSSRSTTNNTKKDLYNNFVPPTPKMDKIISDTKNKLSR